MTVVVAVMDAYRYLMERLSLSTHQQLRVRLAGSVAMHNFAESVPDKNLVHRLSQVQWSGDVGTRLGAVFSTGLTLWYCFSSHGLGVRFEISSEFSGAGHGQGLDD